MDPELAALVDLWRSRSDEREQQWLLLLLAAAIKERDGPSATPVIDRRGRVVECRYW
jgi:hypothetical protein